MSTQSRARRSLERRDRVASVQGIRVLWNHPARHQWPEEIAALLGKMTDVELARVAQLGLRAVSAERKRRGIAAYEAKPPVEWTSDVVGLLGTMPDARIAAELGISTTAVAKKRQSLGIPSFDQRRGKWQRFRWTVRAVRLLGKQSDPEVAKVLGIARHTVRVKRNSLGIPPANFHRIEWTDDVKAKLGNVPDEEIAAEVGACKEVVSVKRRALGILPNHLERLPLERSEKLKKLLATSSAEELERRYKIASNTVRKLRVELGIATPPWRTRGGALAHRWKEDEIALLGTMTDVRLGALLGVTEAGVAKKRKHLGIPSFRLGTRGGRKR